MNDFALSQTQTPEVGSDQDQGAFEDLKLTPREPGSNTARNKLSGHTGLDHVELKDFVGESNVSSQENSDYAVMLTKITANGEKGYRVDVSAKGKGGRYLASFEVSAQSGELIKNVESTNIALNGTRTTVDTDYIPLEAAKVLDAVGLLKENAGGGD